MGGMYGSMSGMVSRFDDVGVRKKSQSPHEEGSAGNDGMKGDGRFTPGFSRASGRRAV